ncbi:hypothetical protein C5F49_06045 [Nitrosopumilus oxyclinae]|uniref:Uncharacterized protein n=1 Tax=Nitrosopumilus oxyclinae TaxID=1959104 RepID=A0A7D5REH6_9ARCH|nr:hypothetical protein [Nitrosopumilus oxyclinae]QLH04925.1 hypothetical protein C5F49_06045 [Nitrosopumilus oxyclinae]
MNNDYESIEDLSKQFSDNVVANQKRLNGIRTHQFLDMTNVYGEVNVKQVVEKGHDFTYREKSQLEILSNEMNELVLNQIKSFEEETAFKNKELMQKKILLEELGKEYSKQLSFISKLSNSETDLPLTPLIVHIDMLLQQQNLSEKQKNHLIIARHNILSGLNLQ